MAGDLHHVAQGRVCLRPGSYLQPGRPAGGVKSLWPLRRRRGGSQHLLRPRCPPAAALPPAHSPAGRHVITSAVHTEGTGLRLGCVRGTQPASSKGAAVPRALGRLPRRVPPSLLPGAFPNLTIFLSSHSSTGQVQTPEACAGAPNTQSPQACPPSPTRSGPAPSPASSPKILLNIPRTSFSISHALCSQASTFHTVRLCPSRARLLQAALQTPSPLFASFSPSPPESLLPSVPTPVLCCQSQPQEAPISRAGRPPWALNHGHPTTPCLLLTRPTDGELTSWPHHSASGTSNPPPPTATSFCSPRAAPPRCWLNRTRAASPQAPCLWSPSPPLLLSGNPWIPDWKCGLWASSLPSPELRGFLSKRGRQIRAPALLKGLRKMGVA